MPRLLPLSSPVLWLLPVAAVVALAACGSQPASSSQAAVPTPIPSTVPSPEASSATTLLTAQQVCGKLQTSAVNQITGDQWNAPQVVGSPASCDFADAGGDRLSIESITYPSKQLADLALVALPGKPQSVSGLGRQAAFLVVADPAGGNQGQMIVRATDTGQYTIRLRSAKVGSDSQSLRDACKRVGQLVLG
jgi:hypothetical protein